MKKPVALPELDHPTLDAESIRHSLYNRLIYTIGKDPINATDRDWFYAAAAVVRERMIERWMETMRSYYIDDRKRVYYLSLEFLMGRTMTNSMLNICAEKEFHDADRNGTQTPEFERSRTRCGVRQRRPGQARSLFSGLHGHLGGAGLRLRHPLRVRYVPPEH